MDDENDAIASRLLKAGGCETRIPVKPSVSWMLAGENCEGEADLLCELLSMGEDVVGFRRFGR